MAMNEREVALVVSAKGGDSRAFEDLYNHYYGKIFALARMTVKNDADAEDILQQAFINAWRNLHTLINPAGFNTWLQKITLNLCYSLLRKKNIAILLDAENDIEFFGEEESDDVLPAIYAERDDLRSRLGKIIDGLSEVQKQTILLYYFNEQKVEEIAYIMECNVSTVKTRLFLARKAIRSEVEEEERKSGEKFYGIPLLPFGDLLVQHFQSEILSAEVSSSVLAAVTEALAQGAPSGLQAASSGVQTVSGGVQAASSAIQTTSIAAGTAKTSMIAGLPLSIKVTAIACIALLCTGLGIFGIWAIVSLSSESTPAQNDYYNNYTDTDGEPTVTVTPEPTPEPLPIPTPETTPSTQDADDSIDNDIINEPYDMDALWVQLAGGGVFWLDFRNNSDIVRFGRPWDDNDTRHVITRSDFGFLSSLREWDEYVEGYGWFELYEGHNWLWVHIDDMVAESTALYELISLANNDPTLPDGIFRPEISLIIDISNLPGGVITIDGILYHAVSRNEFEELYSNLIR